jgi:hypothetical protein
MSVAAKVRAFSLTSANCAQTRNGEDDATDVSTQIVKLASVYAIPFSHFGSRPASAFWLRCVPKLRSHKQRDGQLCCG